MASAISSAGTAPSNNVPSPPPEPDAKPGDETAASSDSTKSDPPKDVIALPSAGASLSPEAAANFDRALYRAGQAADNTDTPAADHENWTDASDAPPAGQLTDKERAARLAEIKADPERYLSITKPVIPPGSGGFAPETEGEISDADAAAFRQGLIDRGVLDPETGELKIGARPLSHGPLDPLASNDGDVTAEAAAGPASVNDLFVNGPPKGSLDNATIKRLDGWLPDAIQNGGGNYVKDGQRSEDIVALAKSMGYEGSQVWERDGRDSEKRVTQYSATGAANFLRDVAEQDAVFDSAAELPSAFDIYDSAMTDRTADKLSGMDDKARRESFVRNLDGGTDLLDRQTDFEKSDFQKLDTWLPSALAGQGEMPNDAGSQTLLVKFAERLGWSNMPEKPGNTDRGSVQFATYERARQDARNMPVEDKADLALDYLKQERFLQKSLVVGSEAGDERASLIFEDGFVGKVVQHGVNQGVITDAVAVDAAMTAGALMNSAAQMNGASADGPVALNPGQFAQALAQRLSPEAVDPKRMMAGFNYVQRAGSLEQQQQRLTETILAFQTKDQAGIGAMTRTTWTEGLADYSGKLADIIGRRIEDPTSKRIANVLDHVGVPGYEKIKLSKGTKLHLANDETGRVADIQVEKKQNGFARFAMDAIMTGLSFTPAAPAAAGYFAMRGVEAAVKGDGIGAVTAGLGAVGGFASSFAAAANGAGAAAKIAQGARLASGAVGVQQGLKNGDLLGAVTSGLSAFSAGAQLNGASGLAQGTANLGRAANGLDAALNKDYLSAASAFSTAAGSQFGGHDGLASTAGNIDKIATLASGILNKDASQIVSAFGDQIAGFTQDWPSLNQPAPASPIGPNTALDENGKPIILRAGYDDPSAPADTGAPTLQIAPGDTLSQIAARHDTTVEALMAANPGITDANSIHAGQQLALPPGVQPVGANQQVRLAEFEEMNGGRPSHLPSPPGPGEEILTGDPGEDQLGSDTKYGESADRLKQALDEVHSRPGAPMDPRLSDDAMAVLREDFDTFDTALQKDPALADGQVSRDDLLHVLRDPGVSDAQRGAARVLLDNDFAFFRMASAGDDGKFNGLIDIGDIDRSFEGGQPRQLTGEQYQDLASDFLDFKMQGVAADDLYGQNRAITEAYAQLYMNNPDFKWAGMAAFASDAVGTGIFRADAGNLSDWPIPGVNALDLVPGADGAQLLGDLGFGNRAVFEDMYWQHMAYQDGGIQALEQMAANGDVDSDQIDAWRLLDQGVQSGNQDTIWAGNQALLRYEQEQILQPMYERERQMWADLSGNGYGDLPVIRHIPYVRDWVGDGLDFPSAINGGVSFQDYMENGDIGNYDQRMKWIEDSMLPEWRSLETDPDAVFNDYVSREILRHPLLR